MNCRVEVSGRSAVDLETLGVVLKDSLSENVEPLAGLVKSEKRSDDKQHLSPC